MKTYLYILVMAATTYLIRVLPLTLIRNPSAACFCARSSSMFPMSRFR